MIEYKPADISYQTAYNAHRNTSHVPERRAEQMQREYMQHIEAIIAEFEQWRTDANAAEMSADLEAYRAGYVEKFTAYLQARSKIVSQMIVGPAGWSASQVRANERRNDTADKRLTEMLEWSKKRLTKLRGKYDPKTRVPIRSNDADAVENLRRKLEAAQQAQALMKKANAVCRSKRLDDAEKVDELVELGLPRESAIALLQPDFAGRIGFASYQLSNNSANVRRIKQRIEALEREAQTRESTPDEYEIGGVCVVENADAGRLQLFFDGKPSAEIRTALKLRGFRWSPRSRCWQRLLNDAARQAAQEVLT